jgi:hypothetical protein
MVDVRDALDRAGINTDTLRRTPDGVWQLDTRSGGQIALGDDDAGHWDASVYEADDPDAIALPDPITQLTADTIDDMAAQLKDWA